MNFFELFFKALNQSSMEYVVLRNYSKLLNQYPDGDVDFLISDGSFKRLKRIIVQLLPDSSIIYSQQRHSNISITYYVYYQKDNQLITLEFARKLLFYKEKRLFSKSLPVKCFYLNTDSAVANRVFYGIIPVLNDDDYFLHLYVEFSINNKKKYRPVLDKLLLAKGRCLDDGGPDYISYTTGSIFNFFKLGLVSLWVKLSSIFFPPGKFVVLMGPDGVGKTTIANLLYKKFHRRTRYALRKQMNNRPRLLTFSRPLKKDSMSTDNETDIVSATYEIKHKKSSIFNRLYHSGRLLFHWLDFLVEYYFVIYPNLVKGGFIFSERYIYDYLLFSERINPNAYGLIRKIIVSLMPRPSEVVILLASPETIRKRKRELGILDIQKFNDRLLKFAKNRKFCIISADSRPDEVVDNVIKNICHN